MIKKLLCILAIVATITTAKAQMSFTKSKKMETISKVGALGVTRFSLDRGINGTDTTYMLTYPNNAFKTGGKDESFYLVASTQNMLDLESAMIETIRNKENKEDLTIKLGDKDYYLRRSKTFGFATLMLFCDDTDFTYISEKEIKKIFSPFHGETKK